MSEMLCIEHSNASSERVFSMVKKIMVDQRSSLSYDTLKYLLRIKINSDQCCTDYNERIAESSTAATSASSFDIVLLNP